MTFRFIHTGDWHYGKPFGRFADDAGALLRHARLDVVGRIAEVARAHGAGHVLVAGDTFDSPGLDDRTIRRLLERLRQAEDLVWHVIPGNHDPARADGIWPRIERLGVPDNVRLHLTAGIAEMAPGVDLLAAPVTSHRMTEDPSAFMDDMAGRPGAIRIGLAHGPVHGFGGEDDAGGLIAPSRVRSARLDYLALGDWHGTKEIAPRVWYAGTPEPEQFQENDPGFVLAVAVDGESGELSVTPVRTGHYRWFRRSYDLGAAGGVGPSTVIDALRALDGEPERCLVRVALEGTATVEEEAELLTALDQLGATFFHIRVKPEALDVYLGGSDGQERDPAVLRIAERLETQMAREGDEGRHARRALRLLARYEQSTAERT